MVVYSLIAWRTSVPSPANVNEPLLWLPQMAAPLELLYQAQLWIVLCSTFCDHIHPQREKKKSLTQVASFPPENTETLKHVSHHQFILWHHHCHSYFFTALVLHCSECPGCKCSSDTLIYSIPLWRIQRRWKHPV